jgi:hypothetical protein
VWFQNVCEKAHAAGFAVGFARGQARALILFLEMRFGEMPASLRQRILSADTNTLDVWVDRAVDARDLESIFYVN